jgi:hypothetical protein
MHTDADADAYAYVTWQKQPRNRNVSRVLRDGRIHKFDQSGLAECNMMYVDLYHLTEEKMPPMNMLLGMNDERRPKMGRTHQQDFSHLF